MRQVRRETWILPIVATATLTRRERRDTVSVRSFLPGETVVSSNARTAPGRLWTKTRATLCCAFGVLIASQGAAAVTVSDGTFANANWSLTQFTGGTGGSVSAGQVLAGGNPGAFRDLTDTLTGGGVGVVLGANIYTPFTYDPGVSGAIASLDYSEDAACTSGCFGDGQSTGPAILQNGNLYILSSSSVITGPGTAWAPHALSGLTALDFGLVDVTTTTIFDDTQHPDFSASGAPIQVGYFRANGTGPGGGGYTLAAGIDNWQITIVEAASIAVVPVPTLGNREIALLALAIGLLGLSFARRAR